MPHIVLESTNAKDLSQADLDLLAQELRAIIRGAGHGNLTVTAVAQAPLGVGSQWHDVLNVFLPSPDFVKDAVYTLLLDRITAFMRKRFTRKHEEMRPRTIVIREVDGKVVEVRELGSADAAPVALSTDVAEARTAPTPESDD